MSHISRVRTKMIDQQALVQALTDLNTNPVVHDTAQLVQGVGSQSQARITGTLSQDFAYGRIRQFGFNKVEDGTFEMTVDTYQMEREFDAFQKNLTQRYAYHATLNTLQAQGFILTEEVSEDGEIRMTLQKV